MSYLPSRKALFSSTIFAILLAVYFSGATQKYPFWLDISGSSNTNSNPINFVCNPHNYTTEIVSIDPLVIYINNFTANLENIALVEVGEPDLAISEVYLHGIKRPSTERTSKSAGLHPSHEVVQCVLSRSRSFLGTLLSPVEDFGFPQLVRYETGEKFDLHHDWYETPQRMRDGSGRMFNRIASFFVFLEDGCEGGETWFPYLKERVDDGEGKWRRHEEGGLAFRPLAGSALFWVNLHSNGTGDRRVMHAGLPLKGGMKTAMNIWPRKIY